MSERNASGYDYYSFFGKGKNLDSVDRHSVADFNSNFSRSGCFEDFEGKDILKDDDYFDNIIEDDDYFDNIIEDDECTNYNDAITEDYADCEKREDNNKLLNLLSSKKGGRIMMGAIAILCLVCACVVPSGDAIDADDFGLLQKTAAIDVETGVDLMNTNIINEVYGLPQVYILPISEEGGPKPKEENYSSYVDENGTEHSIYKDETISVDCYKMRFKDNGSNVIANIAKVKVAHPTQIRSAFAGGKFSQSARFRCSEIANSVNAVVAINGEFYNHRKRVYTLIRNGTVYRDSKQNNANILFIDNNGDFIFMSGKEAKEKGIYDKGDKKILHNFSFGPVLVKDGEALQFKPGQLELFHYYRQPCSAIGQTGPLEYVLVAIEGRIKNSAGMEKNSLAKFMKELGCIQAYNLDGGQSSTLVFKGKPFNTISNGGDERTFGDVLYFATAIPNE